MTPDSPPARRACRQLRVPAFYPVPTRTRRDGWTLERQADFLGMLAETGSVIGACEAVGISRKSAYALRVRPGAESFTAAAARRSAMASANIGTIRPRAQRLSRPEGAPLPRYQVPRRGRDLRCVPQRPLL